MDIEIPESAPANLSNGRYVIQTLAGHYIGALNLQVPNAMKSNGPPNPVSAWEQSSRATQAWDITKVGNAYILKNWDFPTGIHNGGIAALSNSPGEKWIITEYTTDNGPTTYTIETNDQSKSWCLGKKEKNGFWIMKCDTKLNLVMEAPSPEQGFYIRPYTG